MKNEKTEVIGKLRSYKELLLEHFDLQQLYLYGSYAKDKNNKDSDIDVAIVVNNLSDDYFSTTPLIWKLRREIDDRVEPVLLDEKEDKSGFLNEIRKYGILI